MRAHHGRVAVLMTVAAIGLSACTSHGSPSSAGSTGPTTSSTSGSATPTTSTTASTSAGPTTSVAPTTTGPALVQLPFGGRQVLPKYRVVAYYGNGQSKALGVLGHYSPTEAAVQVANEAKKWDTPTRPALPAMELIVTAADGFAGSDGNYSHDTSISEIQPWLDAARSHHELLILDLQPGRQSFMSVITRYQSLLLQPDVGVALDSEWRMGPTQIPAHVIGHVDASEVNQVTAWLSKLTTTHGLPQKVVVLHAFTQKMIVDKPTVKPRPGLAIVFHFDGHGSRNDKLFGYNLLKVGKPFFNGFKLFLTEDKNIFQPAEVEALKPAPDFVSYQ